MSVLTASNLAKSYGPQDVFEGVSLEIPHGAKIALVGPNGSGKTTLLHLMEGSEEPTAGAVHRAKGLRVAYLPQQADFSGVGTLRDVTLEVFVDLQAQWDELRRLEAAMAHPATREEALQRYGPALEAFELAGGYTYEQRIEQVLSGLGFDEDDFRRPVAQLSGGQKTRALLARLLLEEPDLLLLDEPTNHLDLRHQVHIMSMIRQRARTGQHSALAALHDINLAARYCSHVVMLFGDGDWCAGPAGDMLSETSLERLYRCPVERLDGPSGPRFHPLSP